MTIQMYCISYIIIHVQYIEGTWPHQIWKTDYCMFKLL